MKKYTPTSSSHEGNAPVASPDGRRSPAPLGDHRRIESAVQRQWAEKIGQSPQASAQHAFGERLNNSPHAVAQRQRMNNLFGAALQNKSATEDELLQNKSDPAAHAMPEQEEPLRGKSDSLQRTESGRDEPPQGKFATAQRKHPDEYGLVQSRFDAVRPQNANDGSTGDPSSGSTVRVLQRFLDEDFEPVGKPTAGELKKCREFAQTVSDLVDRAFLELMTGKVDDWKGARIGTFLGLVLRGSPMAVTHAGNAMEERVYTLMSSASLPYKWTAQISEAMGAASKPDIVVHVSDDREALVDITSDRKHILKKAGGWFTSERYIYVAEAWFPSITADDVANIKKAIEAGGIDTETAKKLKAEADEKRQKEYEAYLERQSSVREEFWKYGNMTAYAKAKFKGSKSEASNYLREHGVKVKGMTAKKGRRGISEETRGIRKKKAKEAKKGLTKKTAAELLKELQSKNTKLEQEDVEMGGEESEESGESEGSDFSESED